MIRYFSTILSVVSLFSVSAHSFSLVVRNRSTHPFTLTKVVQVPGTSVSDEAYLSDAVHSKRILGNCEVRYYVCLSLEDYISRGSREDRLIFKSKTGGFEIKFSNIDGNLCPEPLLCKGRSIDVVLTDQLLGFKSTVKKQYAVDGPFKITSYFDRDTREYIVLIEISVK